MFLCTDLISSFVLIQSNWIHVYTNVLPRTVYSIMIFTFAGFLFIFPILSEPLVLMDWNSEYFWNISL